MRTAPLRSPDDELPTPANDDRPIVLFGGTFDPPHRRHVELLRGVDAILRAKQVLVIPAWQNPQRTDGPVAGPQDRAAMCALAFGDLADTVVLPIELDAKAPVFTIETVEKILAMQERGEVMRGPLRLVVGSDQALNFRTWKDWERLTTLATPAVVLRPPHTREEWGATLRANKEPAWAEKWERWTLPIDPVQVSSTEIRRRLQAKEPVGDMLVDPVAGYIRSRGLYGATEASFVVPAPEAAAPSAPPPPPPSTPMA